MCLEILVDIGVEEDRIQETVSELSQTEQVPFRRLS